MTLIRRRAVLAGSVAASLPLKAKAQGRPGKLVIIAHRVHQLTATEGPAGDVTAAWRKENGVDIEWVTFDLNAIHDRLFREASLSHTDVNIGFILNTRAVPSALRLFEPLDPYMAKSPIPDFKDMSQNFVDAFKVDGAHVGIPYRQAATGLHYNAQIFEERGVAGPPVVVDDLLPICRKLTHTAANGTPVAALAFEADNYTMQVELARAYGGDLITEDYKLAADQPPFIKALTLLRTLYAEGHLPRNITAMSQNDLIGAMESGQIAMVPFPWGRTVLFNNPKASKFAGKFKTTFLPNSKELHAKGGVICTAEFWAMAIPRHSQYKDYSWSFIRELSLPKNTVSEAINGNGPVRVSAYSDPRLQKMMSYWQQESLGLKWARIPMPAFPASQQAKDIIVEETQAVMLGMETPQAAGANLMKRLRPLLPA